MILTPLDHSALAALLPAFERGLADEPLALAVLRRITAQIPEGDLLTLSTDPAHHAQGVELCRAFGFELIDCDPHDYFTWDGKAVAVRMEPSVLIHEVAHYQCAAPERRHLLDFGLGAGPETGRKAEADAQTVISGMEADIEEAMSSLLGILWEAELGQPAILAFLEQNWLEGGARRSNLDHFIKIVRLLAENGLIDGEGRPTTALRQADDATFFAPWRETARENG